MDNTMIVLLVSGAACGLMIAIYVTALVIAKKSIFPGSGSPISMAQTLLSSIHVASQHLLGVLVITLICVLMLQKVVTAEAGLPLLSAVAGYLLAKTFKDVNISPTRKTRTDDAEA
ncbi:MAG: hypothetical protein A2498_10860 [Lentisphaerae bacterium RIFOXYC12_FULL_60_16]|nr:MAG: hypothetical protein A2498_10860 [Lentisphaerae bacterium RIFOXYC12_FULL_60_16]OGV75180.1 MAG: hypothetical protein A2340_01200 [Lentisphaerae bacterium RIFOXYB12_FULL_60_10]